MDNYKLVMPEDLNHQGYLFGGKLLAWVDEYVYIAATLDFPGCSLVTIGLDRVEFHKGARQGSVLKFEVERTHIGTSSVQYAAIVLRTQSADTKADPMFSTRVTYVRVDENGEKCRLPPPAEGDGS